MNNKVANDWFRLFNLARDHAAQELQISNDLLNAVDEINALVAKQQIPEEQAIKITQGLMEAAIKLAEQSKKMSVSIYALAGAP